MPSAMHELQTQIECAMRRIDLIHGSLEAMRGIENAVQDVLLTTNLSERHVCHMKASERVFRLHQERLIQEQKALIALLTAQQQRLRELLATGMRAPDASRR